MATIGYNSSLTVNNGPPVGSVGLSTYYYSPNSTVPMSWGIATTGGTGSCTGNYISITYKYTLEGFGKDVQLPANSEYKLPDGSKLVIDDKGNYKIEDKDAKVTYQANRIREFSPYLNASDLLAEFVNYVRTIGVKQHEVLGLPIELFINWLVIEAATRDKDQIPEDVVPVEKHKVIKLMRKPKCLRCGRYIPHDYSRNRFAFCNIEHGKEYVGKLQPQLVYQNN